MPLFFLASCTKRKGGKIIERSEYMDQIDANRLNFEANKDLYKRRQEIVEHPFGTIKRQWGFDHIMTKKTKKRAGADIGLIMIGYNLRRLINILGFDKIKVYLMKQIAMNPNKSAILLYFKQLGAIWKIYNNKHRSKIMILKMSQKPLFELKRA